MQLEKEVFNYEEYQEYMRSKLVRTGKDRTYTPVDYFTDEQMKEFYKLGVNNLEAFEPTPKHIREHINFSLNLHSELIKEYPDDEFLISLKKEENIVRLVSREWYRKYINF